MADDDDENMAIFGREDREDGLEIGEVFDKAAAAKCDGMAVGRRRATAVGAAPADRGVGVVDLGELGCVTSGEEAVVVIDEGAAEKLVDGNGSR